MTPLRKRMIEDMKLRRLSPRTIHIYTYNVEKFSCFFKQSPEMLTSEDIRLYILYLTDRKRAAPLTINQVLNSIRFLWVHTLKREWEFKQSIKYKVPLKLPVILNRDEITKLYSVIDNRKYRIAFLFCYSCGLRLSEMLSLKPCDIDLERLTVHVKAGKGNKDRIVPIPESLKIDLSHYLREEECEYYLFPSRSDKSKSMCPTTFQKYMNKIKLKCKITKNITPHSLRHTYATHLLENGVPLKEIQRLLGHKNIQTTLGYTHLTSDSKDITVSVINQMVPDPIPLIHNGLS